jgi:cell division cycle 20, cofactor of APC complex
VYLWNAQTGTVEELCSLPNESEYVSSLSWSCDGHYLAIGTSEAKVDVWDVVKVKKVREFHGHTNRVSALSWNKSILSSGGRDGVINNWDVRKRKDQALVARLETHDQEICGLKWSPNGQQLASGGNDNLLCIWDANFRLQHRLTAHQAAVKALAWCPFQSNLLASGGGSADRCIKFWNTTTGALLNSIDTESQVCGLQWNRHEKEILSSHGYSKNQLCLWKYPSLVKIGEMTGHTQRVLHMAQNPEGSMVVTAAADETLRFWKCFGEPQAKVQVKVPASGVSQGLMSSRTLR